jgi:hypothetical protein
LRVFHTVDGQEQTAHACFCGGRVGREQVFNGQGLLLADESDNALMGGGFGHYRELLAGLLANADAGLAEGGDEALKTLIFAFAGYKYMVKATPAGFERLLDGMHAVQNFHER